jgi:hypothetical protein
MTGPTPSTPPTTPTTPRSVQVPELLLDRITAPSFAARIFGPDRAAYLAAQLPATDAAATAARDAQETALTTRVNWIDNAQESKIRELDDLPADPYDPATQAYRARIRARFAELHEERELLEAQLKALAKTTPAAADTALLDQLPLAGDILPRLPPRLKAKLFAAFDLSILWNKPGQQVTVRAEISDATLQAITAILDASQDSSDDTHTGQPDPIGNLAHTPRAITVSLPPGLGRPPADRKVGQIRELGHYQPPDHGGVDLGFAVVHLHP